MGGDSKKDKNKIKYANEFIYNMVLGDPKTCVYQFIFDKYDSNEKNIIQYCFMHGLVLCIKLNIHVAHMFYTWSFIHNTAVAISIKKNKYKFSLNAYTTVFAWGSGNSN